MPGATFVHVDVRRWSSPEASWDAVCAFFPFLQMPPTDTAAVLADIARRVRARSAGGCSFARALQHHHQ